MNSDNKENIPPEHLAIIAPSTEEQDLAPGPGPGSATALSTPVAATTATSSHASAETIIATASVIDPTIITGAAKPPAAQTIKKELVKTRVYRQRIFPKGCTTKHAPICPRGTVFLLSDNSSLDKTPLKKGVFEPKKLNLHLIDTKGNIHIRFFPDKDENKWEDSTWISDANKWRNQVLRRMMKHDPNFATRGIRPKWGMRETTSLKAEVEKKVKEVGGRRLTGQEWDEVTAAHNEKFDGDVLRAGESLINGQVSKSAQKISKRTPLAIRSLFDRSLALKTFLDDLMVETEVEM